MCLRALSVMVFGQNPSRTTTTALLTQSWGRQEAKVPSRREEMTEVCQELARQHDPKVGGTAAPPPSQKV